MRALLITAQAGAASIADAVVGPAGPPGGPPLYATLPPLDDPGALAALSAAAAFRPRGFALVSDSGADVQRLGARLAVEEARLGLAEGSFRILAFPTQSARAVQGLSSYAGASARLDALVFEAPPFGGRRRSAGPARLARDLMLIAARAAGVRALDAAFADIDDLEGLRAEAREAADDGFDGKAALNEAQAAAIQAVFA